jgi:hypothetical protein
MNEAYFRETTDLGLAAALCALNFKLAYLDRSKDKSFFGFQDINDVEGEMKKYEDRKLLVEPQKFLESLSALKIRIYGQ